jgi:hypothetical protein
MEYYYTDVQNQPRGPVTLAELQELVAQGAVHPYTMVAQVGSQQWVPIGTVLPGLVPFAPQPTEPLAIWSICLSVAGLSCYGLTAIGGVICGHMALSALKRKPTFQGRGLAIAGLIVGYLMLLVLVGMIGLIVFMGVLGASQSH